MKTKKEKVMEIPKGNRTVKRTRTPTIVGTKIQAKEIGIIEIGDNTSTGKIAIEINNQHEHQFDHKIIETNPLQLHLRHAFQASTTNQEFSKKMIRCGIHFKTRGTVIEMLHLYTRLHPLLRILPYVKLLLKEEQDPMNSFPKG